MIKIQKNPTTICCQDLLSSIFNLNKFDYTVYKTVQKIGETKSTTLAKKLNKERSTIYRSLQKLTTCGLCIKTTKTISSGGYYHSYSCADPKQIKKEIQTCIDTWYAQMKQKLQTIEQELG